MQSDEGEFQTPQENSLAAPHEEHLLEVLPAPTPPQPNLWWSIVWSIGFLAVLYGTVFGVLFAVLLLRSILAPQNRFQVETVPESDSTSGETTQDQRSSSLKAAVSAKLRSDLVVALPAAMFMGELVSGVFAFVVIRLLVGRDWMRILGLRRPSLSQLVLVLISLPCVLVLPDLIREAASEMGVPSFQDPARLAELFGQWPLGFAILVIGVGPGLSEELWCRGFLGRGLVGNYGAWVGILITSIIFGALHIDPAHAVAIVFMGLWLHFVYLTSRSWWLPVLLHTLNNSVATIASFVQNAIQASDEQSLEGAAVSPILKSLFSYLQIVDDAEQKTPYLIFAAATCLVGAVGWALYQCRTRLVTRQSDLRPPWRPDFPGVEYPPPGTSTVVWRPWPGWQACGIVLAGILIFALCIYLAPIIVVP
jgi:membrane protease YdiL (CAAX protease family)